jgi:signal transduction histidine kinase
MGDEAADLRLAGLVHDLNNVFETICDAADLLEEDPKWAKVAAAINRSVSRGQRIVDSYSAGALGKQDFNAVLDNSIEFACDLLKAVNAPQVEFVRSVDPGIQVGGSAAAWERVLLNLFVNSAQAMKTGGTVEVHAHREEGCTEICVADTGPGIPDEILPQIFDPHFSTKSANSGLGLHIVKSLVAQNGGEVHAANRTDGAGAAFHIRMPRI